MPSRGSGGGATGTIRPSTSPRMPTTGFEVRGRIVRQRSPGFAHVHSVVDRRGQRFTAVRESSPEFAGVAISVTVKTDSLGIVHLGKLFGQAPLTSWRNAGQQLVPVEPYHDASKPLQWGSICRDRDAITSYRAPISRASRTEI
jgi:hypothetical protein